jgi:hypothetical protein
MRLETKTLEFAVTKIEARKINQYLTLTEAILDGERNYFRAGKETKLEKINIYHTHNGVEIVVPSDEKSTIQPVITLVGKEYTKLELWRGALLTMIMPEQNGN